MPPVPRLRPLVGIGNFAAVFAKLTQVPLGVLVFYFAAKLPIPHYSKKKFTDSYRVMTGS